MGTRRTRTALYPEVARLRLGKAVTSAREAAGYTSTAEFARATGRAARAIYALENGEPTVGQSVLQAVGRTLGERLDAWGEDTPRTILEGGDVPVPVERLSPAKSPSEESHDAVIARVTYALYSQGWSDERVRNAIAELEKGQVIPPAGEQPTALDG